VVLAPAAARAKEWAPVLVRVTALVMEPAQVPVSAPVLVQALTSSLPAALMIRSSQRQRMPQMSASRVSDGCRCRSLQRAPRQRWTRKPPDDGAYDWIQAIPPSEQAPRSSLG
jgi:hypothetical protein